MVFGLTLVFALWAGLLGPSVAHAEATYKAKIKQENSYRLKRGTRAAPKSAAKMAVEKSGQGAVYKVKREEKAAYRFDPKRRPTVYKSQQNQKAGYIFDKAKGKPVKRKPPLVEKPPEAAEKPPEGTKPPGPSPASGETGAPGPTPPQSP